MTVLITLTTLGIDTGPLFNLSSSPDGTTFTQFATGIAKLVLEGGYSATVPDGTTTIRVTSTGVCTNYVNITISGLDCGLVATAVVSTPATTTSTTTAAPTIVLSTATCRSGNCNDNSTCSVRLPVNVYNAPVGYDVQMVVEGSSGASITYLQSNGYATYTENNALATLEVRFDLYDTPGGTLLYSTGTIYLSHQSYWSILQSC